MILELPFKCQFTLISIYRAGIFWGQKMSMEVLDEVWSQCGACLRAVKSFIAAIPDSPAAQTTIGQPIYSLSTIIGQIQCMLCLLKGQTESISFLYGCHRAQSKRGWTWTQSTVFPAWPSFWRSVEFPKSSDGVSIQTAQCSLEIFYQGQPKQKGQKTSFMLVLVINRIDYNYHTW